MSRNDWQITGFYRTPELGIVPTDAEVKKIVLTLKKHKAQGLDNVKSDLKRKYKFPSL